MIWSDVLLPPEPLWHRQYIIAEVKKRGSSLAALGRSIGLAKATMAWALIRRHPRANEAIAEFLDVPMHELWPSWYPPTIPSGPQPIPNVSAESRAKQKAA